MFDFESNSDMTVARYCARAGAEESVKNPDGELRLRTEMGVATTAAKKDAERFLNLNAYASISGSLKAALSAALAREEVLAKEVAELRAQVADLKTELDAEE